MEINDHRNPINTTAKTDAWMAPADEPLPLELVARLCEGLRTSGVSYCHWKSTATLNRSAVGKNDLDLLIDRADAQRFTILLSQLGFKLAKPSQERQLPGVLDYYGLDSPTGELVHVHAHYQLVIGNDMTKNYHLPIEQAYLETSVQAAIFRIPSPEFELILFVIRMVLKHSTWDSILSRQGALSASEQRELVSLESSASPLKMNSLLEQHLPYIDLPLFNACWDSLHPGINIWKRIQSGQRLLNRLKPNARRSQVADILIKLWRRGVRSLQWRLFKHSSRPHWMSGGAMITVIGGDGAGKSTLLAELSGWLSPHFDLRKIHLGKPSWSWTTIAVRGMLKVGTVLGLYPFMKSPFEYVEDAQTATFPGYPWLIREVCTARDRYLTYRKARRFASNGGLVLSDRYPLPQIKKMDSPQAERMTRNCRQTRFLKILTELEKAYYRSIIFPELLIVLKLHPEIAIQRKPDEDPGLVRSRSTEVWEMDWQNTPAHVIDASLPKDEVLLQVKKLIWSAL